MGYKEVYNAWKADPEAFWMEAAEAIDWDRKPSRALNDDNAPLYEWFNDGMVNTCWNAVDRHVEAGRGDQVAVIHDSPITRFQARRSPIPNCATASPLWPAPCRPRVSAKVTGSSSTCPWCPKRLRPCWPAPGSVPSTRSSLAVSPPTNWLSGSTMRNPRRLSPPLAGWSRGAWCITNRFWTGRLNWPTAQARLLRHFPARTGSGRTGRRPRCRLARVPGGRRLRRIAFRSRAIIRFISCTPLAPPANPRALCVRLAGIWWR